MIFLSTFGVQAETLLEAQMNLENRLTKVVRSYDKHAYVFVMLEQSEKKLRLPSTPFLFDSPRIDSANRAAVGKMSVKILTRVESFPEQIDSIIKSIAQEYTENSTIEKIVVPVAPEELGKLGNSEEEKKLKDKVKELEDQLEKERKEAEAKAQNNGKTQVEDQTSEISPYMDYIFTGGLIAGLFLFGFFVLAQRKSNQISLEVLKEQMGNLGRSFESTTLGGGGNAASESSSDRGGASGKIELSTSSSSIWETFDLNSIESIMTDCYWSYEDDYASFIWDKLTVDKRVELLNRGTISNEYVTYICTLDGRDKEFANDPYYLAPINVGHLSNDDLAEMVISNPALMGKLSKMRQKTLPIKATDRVKLVKETKTSMVDLSILENKAKSEERIIKTKEIFNFATVEEEQEIIDMSENDLDVMERFPSLAWVLNLDKSEIEDLLGVYTAKQLASIWIGPEKILTKLEGYIPEKKAALMKSYLDKMTPNRNTVYNELISQAINQLREKESPHAELKQAA